MFPPWHELKQCEIRTLRLRDEGLLDSSAICALRRLFEKCKDATGADDAICYHGAFSLIAEFDGDLDVAIRHRRIEIEKIRHLQELARVNEGDRVALESYGVQELERRIRVLDDLITQIAG